MGKKDTMHDGKPMKIAHWRITELIRSNLPVLIVLLSCLVFSIRLGALQPELYFQKTVAETGGVANGSYAYATGDMLLFKLPHSGNMSARAAFSGSGHVSSVSYQATDQSSNVTKIVVGGKVACSPCITGKEYPVQADGEIAAEVFAKEAPLAEPSDSDVVKRAFFEKIMRTGIDDLVAIKLSGGWQPDANSAVPSSFYGEDAPAHIHRVPIGASHLMRLQWPSAEYTFLSAMPSSLIYLMLGAGYQYAFKLGVILMFFLPVAAFYLFSRKLSRGKDAIFLFASLIYLFFPSQGMLEGGGADLFMYGMVARTFAASLSLFSLLFAYEFVVEKNTPRFWFSLLFFVLAVASNQRIFIALAIGMGALFVLSLVVSDARRAILLGIACAASSVFLFVPLVVKSSYYFVGMAVGGVSTETLGWALVGLFQVGYFALPLLFVAGLAAAISKREMFLLFLFATCALVFVSTTSPEVNRFVPFLDGLRFMSSFFPPMFFIAGAGALLVFETATGWAGKAGMRLKLDRLDTTMSFCLAILAPLAVIFASVALSTMDQYRDTATSPVIASEYSELQTAYGIIGDECVFIQGRFDFSQYTVYEDGFERSIISGAESSGDIIAAMNKTRCRYLLLGNVKLVTNITQKTRSQEYDGFRNESQLEEIAYGGSNRLFVLKGVEPSTKVESAGAQIESYSFDYDRGSVQGECPAGGCSVRIRKDALPNALACSGVAGCWAEDGDDGAIHISNIPKGKFNIVLEPRTAYWFYPTILAGALAVLACWYAASRLPGKKS